jgi:glycosyltransferase involved in cell wall biosynthesis
LLAHAHFCLASSDCKTIKLPTKTGFLKHCLAHYRPVAIANADSPDNCTGYMIAHRDKHRFPDTPSGPPVIGARLLLYAAVPHSSMLEQGFYAAEIEGLRSLREVSEVHATNKIKDVWSQNYDGLICYFYSHAAFAAMIAKLKGKPAIATGGGEQLFRSISPNIFIFTIRILLFLLTLIFTKFILSTSNSDYAQMQAVGLFRRSAIKLSFHGAPAVDQLNPEHFSRSRTSGSMLTICGMDTYNNVKRKGLFRAIDLLSHVRAYNADARLTIIGRTTCSDLVREYAIQKCCSDAVIFAGYVSEDEKLEMLRNSRYYIQLSEYEGFGVGALEAMAMGCQVIHSNVGGLRDTVKDFGIILSPDEPIDIDSWPPYAVGDWQKFESHMSQFTVSGRANAILEALALK